LSIFSSFPIAAIYYLLNFCGSIIFSANQSQRSSIPKFGILLIHIAKFTLRWNTSIIWREQCIDERPILALICHPHHYFSVLPLLQFTWNSLPYHIGYVFLIFSSLTSVWISVEKKTVRQCGKASQTTAIDFWWPLTN